MARGKQTCKILKEIRRQIAEANDIEFITSECQYKGDCLGTCPKCEAEVRYLEQQLRARRLAGKAVAIAGISAGVIMLSGCDNSSSKQAGEKLHGEPVEVVEISGQMTGDTCVVNEPMEENVPTEPFNGVKEGEVSDERQEVKTTEGEIVHIEDSPVPKPPKDYPLPGAVEVMPQFPGGGKKLMEFIASNLQYPESLVNSDVQGRVIISFMVRKDGSIGDVQVIRGIHPDLDAEALRVVKLLPNFIPATVEGKPVDSKFTLPVTFRLQ